MRFVQAAHYTNTNGRQIDLVVQHLMVAPETPDRAEACAQMFATTTREASAHYCVDNNSTVQCVKDDDVAWAAPGCNSDGIQIEQAGTLQTPQLWDDEYSKAMLERNAKLSANLLERYGIPALWRSAEELKAGKRGITDHWEATKAFRLSTHTDCGQGYRDHNSGGGKSAKDSYLEMVREILDPTHDKNAEHERVELPTVTRGDTGWLVKKVQKHLIAHGYILDRDGAFGAETFKAVRRFQDQQALPVTGIVDRRTWRRLRS